MEKANESDKTKITETLDADKPAHETLNPDMIVEVQVCDARNANKQVKSRWGVVTFDAQGVGALKIAIKDMSTLDQLGWLSAHDRERYLAPVSVVMDAAASANEVTEVTEELEATRRANVRLAQKNAELEAQVDHIKIDMQKRWGEHEIALKKELVDRIKEIEAKLGELMKVHTDLTKAHADLTKVHTDLKKDYADLKKKHEK
jgi:hypothetical protein